MMGAKTTRRNNPIPISCVMMFLGLEAISDAVGWGLAWLVFHFFSAFRRSLPHDIFFWPRFLTRPDREIKTAWASLSLTPAALV